MVMRFVIGFSGDASSRGGDPATPQASGNTYFLNSKLSIYITKCFTRPKRVGPQIAIGTGSEELRLTGLGGGLKYNVSTRSKRFSLGIPPVSIHPFWRWRKQRHPHYTRTMGGITSNVGDWTACSRAIHLYKYRLPAAIFSQEKRLGNSNCDVVSPRGIHTSRGSHRYARRAPLYGVILKNAICAIWAETRIGRPSI